MFRFLRVIVAIGVSVALLGACSSGSAKSAADTNKRLTKAGYIEASDAICSTFKDRIGGVVVSAGSGLTVSEAKDTFTKKLIPLFQLEHKELLALKPPKADEALLKSALIAMNSGINTIIGRVASAGSITDLNAIRPAGMIAWKIQSAKYGMQICGAKAAK